VVEITGLEQKRCWDAGEFPPVEKVRPGVWSIPVPIPANPLRYVLVYALELEHDRGVALIDAGWNTDDSWRALTDGLATAGFAITDVRGVLVTHIHPDHYGLAGRVRAASGAWVALHPADAAALSDRYGPGMPDLLTRMRAFLAEAGVPPEEMALSDASMAVRQFVDTVKPDVLLEDGDRPELPGWDLVSIWTPGHSPGHLCFASAERRLLMSGDHVLPRISPNISFHTQQTENPLADFLDSLAKVGAMESEIGVDEVLPAHEYRFRGLAERATNMIAHHEDRLGEIRAAITAEPGLTCWDITTELTWSRPWDQIHGWMRRAAMTETLAHLVLLRERGGARRDGHAPQRWYLA
jgi:glyoxylase-like metal-dependent hydrolase (beta-lactamase superfamily II)